MSKSVTYDSYRGFSVTVERSGSGLIVTAQGTITAPTGESMPVAKQYWSSETHTPEQQALLDALFTAAEADWAGHALGE